MHNDEENEAILQSINGEGCIFYFTGTDSSDITIDGVVIKDGVGDMVHADNSYNHSNITIQYSILRNSGDEALQLRKTDGALVQYNYVYNTGGDGIGVCCGSQNVTVANNEISLVYGHGGLYYYSNVNAAGMIVEDN